MMRGKQEVLNAFDRLDDSINRHRSEIPEELKSSVITEIVRSRSIDTTRFIQAVNWHEDSSGIGFHFLLDAFTQNNEVTYDGFLEFDGETRNWTGRYNYKKGIEGSRFESIFDEIMDDAFAFRG